MKQKHDYFDEAARNWEENPRRVELAAAVARSIRDNIPLSRNMTCMEYGCGTGLVSMLLAPYLGHITAVDTSEQMLKVLEGKLSARDGINNISTYQLDLTKNNFPNDLFREGLDLIFSSMTLHHVGPVEKLLLRFYQLLRPGGWIAVADLDKEDGDFHGRDIPGVAHYGFDREQISRMLSKFGFEKIKILTAHKIKKNTESGASKIFPVFLALGKKLQTNPY